MSDETNLRRAAIRDLGRQACELAERLRAQVQGERSDEARAINAAATQIQLAGLATVATQPAVLSVEVEP